MFLFLPENLLYPEVCINIFYTEDISFIAALFSVKTEVKAVSEYCAVIQVEVFHGYRGIKNKVSAFKDVFRKERLSRRVHIFSCNHPQAAIRQKCINAAFFEVGYIVIIIERLESAHRAVKKYFLAEITRVNIKPKLINVKLCLFQKLRRNYLGIKVGLI